jgi:hypothetical protein
MQVIRHDRRFVVVMVTWTQFDWHALSGYDSMKYYLGRRRVFVVKGLLPQMAQN